MKEEIQMIKEELEKCKHSLKHAKIRHYLLWIGSLPLAVVMVFMVVAYSKLAFLPIIGVLIYALLARWNIEYHNNLVLDIEDLEYALEKLTK